MNDLEPLESSDVIQHVNIWERRASRCSIAHKSESLFSSRYGDNGCVLGSRPLDIIVSKSKNFQNNYDLLKGLDVRGYEK